MIDTSHLDALRLRLSNERFRFHGSGGAERAARAVLVAGIEREIAGELKFLNLPTDPEIIDDDALLAQLSA